MPASPRLPLLLPPLLSSFTSPLSSLLQAISMTSPPDRRLCTASHLDDLDQRLTASPPLMYNASPRRPRQTPHRHLYTAPRLTTTTSTNASSTPLYSASPPHHCLTSSRTHHHLTSAIDPFTSFLLFSFFLLFFFLLFSFFVNHLLFNGKFRMVVASLQKKHLQTVWV
jgi:hypothetical protein